MAKFCRSCGTQLEEGAIFCKNCGTKIDDSIETKSFNKQNTKTTSKIKIIIPIAVILLLVIAIIGFSVMNKNSIEVTEVSVPDSNTIKYIGTREGNMTDKSHDPFTETIQVTFKSKKDIKDVMHIKLDNVVLTFDDNTTTDMGSIESSGYDKSLNGNNYLDRDNAIYKNAIYAINFETTMDTGNKDNNKYKIATTKHIVADILVDTDSQENKVIGHLDNDIVWYDDNRNEYLESLKNNNTSETNDNTNSTQNTDNDTESESNPSTIDDVYTYSVQGVDFNIPSIGHMRTSEALSFEYNGETCEVQKVPQYESSTYNHELSSVTFSKNYQDGEPYQLIVNNHPWIGVKVEKGGKWFHISMNINDANEAEKLVDWMSQHNTWNAP